MGSHRGTISLQKLIAYPPPAKDTVQEVASELIYQNIKRERMLSIALIVFLTIIISTILFSGKDSINLYVSKDSIYIHFILIALSVLFLIITHNIDIKQNISLSFLGILHHVIIAAVLLLCALIAVNNELMDQRPFAYIIAIYSIAATLILDKKESFMIYLSSYMVYIVGVIYNMGFSIHLVENVLFTLPMLLLAMMVCSINYTSYLNNYINNQLIQQKNNQLKEMYKTVEDTLSVRTEQLNHAREIDKLRTSFFSNISHELRTPLNVIYSAEQMLQLVCRSENIESRKSEILRYNNMVQQNCYRLIRLIENLIDITEIDSGLIKINLGRHDIARLIKGVTFAVGEYTKERNIKLNFSSLMENRIIVCDGEKIERIMLNLLSNAVKFTPKEGTISVSLYENNEQVVIHVIDTGIGIPYEMRQTIFEPFVQVDKSISRLQEGSGIGLSIVKAFVELHKGDIEIFSEEGSGSCFVIKLPIYQQESAEDFRRVVSDYKYHEKVRMEFSDIYY